MQNNPVNSKEIIEFVAIANEYCTLAENSHKPHLPDFVSNTHELLVNLYQKAMVLPEMDAKFEDYNEHFVTEKEYENVRKKIKEKLGHYDSYHDINTPVKQNLEGPIGECISEDMSDIFQSLKDFIMLYKTGRRESMYEAVWECRQSFKNYWGQRLTNSLRALHFLKYSGEELAEITDDDSVFEDELKVGDIDTSEWIVSQE